MDVNNHSGDVNMRKAFGLRSNYVQITFNYVQVAQKLRKYYVKNQFFFVFFKPSIFLIKSDVHIQFLGNPFQTLLNWGVALTFMEFPAWNDVV